MEQYEAGKVTLSWLVSLAFDGKCSKSQGTREWHRHGMLFSDKKKFVAVYPSKMVAGILEAMRDQ